MTNPARQFESALESRPPYLEVVRRTRSRTIIRQQSGPTPIAGVASWDAMTPDGSKEYSQDARWATPYVEWTLDLHIGPWVHYGRRWGHVNAWTGEFVYQGYMAIRTQIPRCVR